MRAAGRRRHAAARRRDARATAAVPHGRTHAGLRRRSRRPKVRHKNLRRQRRLQGRHRRRHQLPEWPGLLLCDHVRRRGGMLRQRERARRVAPGRCRRISCAAPAPFVPRLRKRRERSVPKCQAPRTHACGRCRCRQLATVGAHWSGVGCLPLRTLCKTQALAAPKLTAAPAYPCLRTEPLAGATAHAAVHAPSRRRACTVHACMLPRAVRTPQAVIRPASETVHLVCTGKAACSGNTRIVPPDTANLALWKRMCTGEDACKGASRVPPARRSCTPTPGGVRPLGERGPCRTHAPHTRACARPLAVCMCRPRRWRCGRVPRQQQRGLPGVRLRS